MYYSNNIVKTTLENWYQTNIANNESYVNKVASGDYFCEEAKVKSQTYYTSDSATMESYSSYTPNFKCTTDGSGKGIVNASIGLMTYDEVSYAGGRGYHKNTNYYLYNPNNPKRWWTMSAAGLSNYGLIDSSAWYVSDDGGFYTYYVSFDCALRPVIILKSTVKISDGNGTVDAPFIVK